MDRDTFVYCTECKYADIACNCGEFYKEICSECPCRKCNCWNCEDSMRFCERPSYKEKAHE
jgi:hypothetical protein